MVTKAAFPPIHIRLKQSRTTKKVVGVSKIAELLEVKMVKCGVVHKAEVSHHSKMKALNKCPITFSI